MLILPSVKRELNKVIKIIQDESKEKENLINLNIKEKILFIKDILESSLNRSFKIEFNKKLETKIKTI